MRQAIAEVTALGEDPDDPTWYWQLIGDLHAQRATHALQTGDQGTALEAGRESLACRRHLVALDPDQDAFRTELARALNQMVMIHGRSGTAEAALGHAAEACDLVDELAQRHGSDEYYRQDQATAWYMRAALEQQLRHHEEAEPSARRAIGLYEALAADHADKLLYRYGLGLSRLTLAQALLAQDESVEAVALLRSGLDISAELRAASPQDGRYVELRRWLLRVLLAALPASAAEVPELQRELEALAPGGR